MRRFYEENSSKFLVPRPAEDFERAVERGQHFHVASLDTKLAATGVFDYGDNLPYVELSETFVTEPLRGFGLQAFFHRLRIASTILTQGPATGITAALDPDNRVSIANALKIGFERWPDPVAQAFAYCQHCPNASGERKCCCDFFILPIDRARAAVNQLLDETASGFVLLRRGSGEELRVGLEVRLLKWQEERTALAEFAAGMDW